MTLFDPEHVLQTQGGVRAKHQHQLEDNVKSNNLEGKCILAQWLIFKKLNVT
jgi:hypothetical protein